MGVVSVLQWGGKYLKLKKMTMKYRNMMVPSIAAKTFFDDAFAKNLFGVPVSRSTHFPAVNIRESEEKFVIELAAPGLEKSDFKIMIEQDTLTISSEKKSEVNVENEKFTRKEYNYNSFSRSFSLPETVDPETVAANYHNGILSVALPKKLVEVKSKVRQVEIL